MTAAKQEADPEIKHFWDRTFLTLKLYRNYRLVWLGSMTEHLGEWAETAATLWLVHKLGGAPLDLAMVAFLRTFPLIFLSTLGGELADRMNRRNIVVYALLFVTCLSIILFILVRTGQVRIWHIFILSFCSSLATAFNHPARQTLIPNLVERKHLMNAVTLDNTTTTASRAISIPIAGLFMARYGVEYIFGARAIGALLAIVWLMMVKVPLTPLVGKRQGMWKNIMEGWNYMRGNPVIMSQVGMYFFAYFAMQASSSFMPIFADKLGVRERGYTLLQAAPGFGAIIGLVTLATMGDFNRKGLYLFIAGITMTLFTALFSLSPIFILSLFLLIVAGAMNNTYMAVNATIIQTAVDDKLRGRVMAWREIAFGLAPTSGLLTGWIAGYMGPTKNEGVPKALLLMSLIFLVIITALFFLLPRVRKYK